VVGPLAMARRFQLPAFTTVPPAMLSMHVLQCDAMHVLQCVVGHASTMEHAMIPHVARFRRTTASWTRS
jgi:hypothetical protein